MWKFIQALVASDADAPRPADSWHNPTGSRSTNYAYCLRWRQIP